VRAVNWDKLGNTSWNREYQIGTLITLSILLLTPMLIVPTIHAERENKLLFPKSIFPQSDAYKTGWAAGFLGQPFNGHHTQDYIFGYLNGTSTYVFNYNQTSGHTMNWYIGAAIADDQYQKGGNFNGSDGLLW